MYNILNFGAQAGSDATEQIQAAIDAARAAGGGKVHVPAGEYRIGTLQLHSHIHLYLEAGARLLCLRNYADFREVGYKHNELGDVRSVLYAMNAHDIKISGEGCIDLQGHFYFDPSKPIIPEIMQEKITPEQITQCTWQHDVRVNQPLFFYNCEQVTLEGISIFDSPAWTITFAESKFIRINSINLKNHPNVPNNDGIHICASSEVIIKNCMMECADDPIAVSSITNWAVPCENIVISDCILRTFSKAIVLGYGQSIVRNVTITNVVIQNSHRGITIMASARTGLVENVTVSNCVIDTKIRAGNWWGNGEPIFIMARHHQIPGASPEVLAREFPINVRNIFYSSIICTAENNIGIIGEKQNIHNVTLNMISFTSKPSANRALKGKLNDLAPAVQTETVPQDPHEYWLVVREARAVSILSCRPESHDGTTLRHFVDISSEVSFK